MLRIKTIDRHAVRDRHGRYTGKYSYRPVLADNIIRLLFVLNLINAIIIIAMRG